MSTPTRQSTGVLIPYGARTHKTIDAVGAQDDCVSTRTDWPQEEFLAWVDATRKRLGIPSDNQLAQRWGIGHTLISGWRNGRQRPSIPTLNQIASVEGEDPRGLWVLAGAANAIDVGLVGDDVTPRLPTPDLPQEVADLLVAYGSDELNDEDRAVIRHHIRLLTRGVLADLEQRRAARKRPTGRAG